MKLTIEQAQERRKQGYYMVLNRKMDRVLLSTRDKEQAEGVKGGRVYGPLRRVTLRDDFDPRLAFPSAHGLGVEGDPERGKI